MATKNLGSTAQPFHVDVYRSFAGAQDDILDRGVYKQKREPVKTDSLSRAENEARTRDPNLGKVMLYQLSYFRIFRIRELFSRLRMQR